MWVNNGSAAGSPAASAWSAQLRASASVSNPNSESQPAQRVPGGVPSGRERLRDVHCVRFLQIVPKVGNLARIGYDRLREDHITADAR